MSSQREQEIQRLRGKLEAALRARNNSTAEAVAAELHRQEISKDEQQDDEPMLIAAKNLREDAWRKLASRLDADALERISAAVAAEREARKTNKQPPAGEPA